MKAPYPWFGGKSTIMTAVWERLGDTPNFIDPFFGSNAALLSRSGWDWRKGLWSDFQNRIETVNDMDCYVANFQRALKHEPEGVARWAADPVNEADLHARHSWLVQQHNFINRMHGRVEGELSDPDYYDVKIAGWWVWGICQWIGGGWCKYPEAQKRPHLLGSGTGIFRTNQQLPHLKGAGMGIFRTNQQLPHLKGAGMGILRARQQLPHVGNAGMGMGRIEEIIDYFNLLSERLQRVRVCCGDWTRVLGPTPTTHNGLTAIFLDPPYSEKSGRDEHIYTAESLTVAYAVRQWAIDNGDNPQLRIALCGYKNEHNAEIPENWERLNWSAHGGYSNRNNAGNDNKTKETIWFSPHCLRVDKDRQMSLLEDI